MARLLGNSLPKELLSKIREQSNVRSSEVPLLVSLDQKGYPNVSLLSFLDIVALSPRRLVFAIGAESSSKRNLLRSRKGTIVIWGGRDFGMYYVKGRIAKVRKKLASSAEGFRLDALVMNVESVSQDHSDVAKLLSTLTYDGRSINKGHLTLYKELKDLALSLSR